MPTTRASLRIAFLSLAALAGTSAAQAQEHEGEVGEVEELVVQATRTGRLARDEPIRVEVVSREEIEEKVLMRPGSIAMLLSETGGLRVQTTSPSLGAANIRVQGMRGRYTQLLADGLPIYGGQASSLGLLQIPPTDLGQVEVIKGAASALYGPSALGGVINLISRRPGSQAEGEVLLNLTTRNGQDVTAYAASPAAQDGWSYSLVVGASRQSRQDLDDDGWVDMPGYDRWTLRPRLFWEGANGGSAFFTVGVMDEQRQGGTSPGQTTPAGAPFLEAQDSRRYDGGLVVQAPLEGLGTLGLRASAMRQEHDHRFGDVFEDDRHDTYFAETSLSGQAGKTSWVGGLAVQADRYRSKTFPDFDYAYTVPALFVQAEHDLADDLTVAGSARWDVHDEYGSYLSPRLSVLYRPGPWTFRASLGRGFYAPTPFVEEIEATGLSRLEPLGDLKAETAETASLEAGYAAGPFEANLTLFASDISNAVQLQTLADEERVRLVNARGKTRTRGAEALLRYRWNDLTVTGSYVYVDADEPEPDISGRRTIPLTPRHTAGMVAMWEREGRGRLGLEAYYTGRQELEDNPYRREGRPYLELGILGELIFGRTSVFLNLENLLDVRQTKYDPMVLPARAPDGRWTVDAWAPTDGFVANAGVRVRFGGD
ncbi:TonB-dependent receptor plug domain-containing protein [Phenylobacterium koreense]|uniref:Iron complex outermembrane receptor protein n=1 Tax=Phenylobacterium koreense TaxID=266125 RepID=A0ABV2ELD9_9CAUL